MLILTDRPASMADRLPPEWRLLEWQTAGRLDPSTSALWGALGSGAAAWSLEPPGATGAFWSRLFVVADAPRSQFDLLHQQLAGPVRDVGPVACLALDGLGFHGHHGRRWSAAAGNLHLSVALATTLPAASHAASLSMLPAVAVCDAVRTATAGTVSPAIKWVNDVVVPEGKLAGVLTATRVLGGGDRLHRHGHRAQPRLGPGDRADAVRASRRLPPALSGGRPGHARSDALDGARRARSAAEPSRR